VRTRRTPRRLPAQEPNGVTFHSHRPARAMAPRNGQAPVGVGPR